MTQWQPVWDGNSKKYYYWNKETQETSWENKTGKPTPAPPTTTTTSKESKHDISKTNNNNTAAADLPTQAREAAKTGDSNDYYSSKEYYEWYMNVMKEHQIQQSAAQTAASFAESKKGDRFAELAMMPGAVGVDGALQVASRDFKQMSYFFDVEKYHQERALDRMQPKVTKKLSRREIEKFKQKKHEKKVSSLLQRMGPDA